MKRIIIAVLFSSLVFLTQARGARAQVCNGGTITGATGYQVCPVTCDPVNDPSCICSLSCAGVTYAVEYCSDYKTTDSCNSAGIGWDCGGGGKCSWSGPIVGGGGGGVCPSECRQGSACGVGYSPAAGCQGNGPGGGCKSNQVCCSANSCGSGGGGSSCLPQVNCPPGTVVSGTVASESCAASTLCGNNAWGTGGAPGSAQAVGECCRWNETGGGNCVWERCPTKNNPDKWCKVCDPVEYTCRENMVYTYECVPSCSAVAPSTPTLVSPS